MAAKLRLSDALHRLKIYTRFYGEGLTEEEIVKMRRDDLRSKHPDRGGDSSEFADANEAWNRVLEHVRQKKMDEVHKCKVCDGTGLVEKVVGFATTTKCKACNGKGKV